LVHNRFAFSYRKLELNLAHVGKNINSARNKSMKYCEASRNKLQCVDYVLAAASLPPRRTGKNIKLALQLYDRRCKQIDTASTLLFVGMMSL
jgi:hypothetical protein